MTVALGMVGGRGYVGEQLLALLASHPDIRPRWVSSRSLAGRRVREVFPQLPFEQLAFEHTTPVQIKAADVVVLALPNGQAAPYARTLVDRGVRVIDLSADYRFDPDWTYALPELDRAIVRGALRVANPGCYATAGQLALAPVVDWLATPPAVFAVSGYSGAGRTPNARNDPTRLADNFLPYALTNHGHQREIARRLQGTVQFVPHVAAFFRGISATVCGHFDEPRSAAELQQRFREFFADEPLIEIHEEIPEVANLRGTYGVAIGGFSVNPNRPCDAVWVVCLDNLMKGAASQAVQNLNLMLGFDELRGLIDG